ncbi:MAG: transcription antitermination factor NusB [Betaproteobacteria bacterium]
MTRREAREAAFIALFQMDVGRAAMEPAIHAATGGRRVDERSLDYVRRTVSGVVERRAEIDATISRLAIGWSLDRMGAVDRNLLRLAVYEILHLDDVPVGAAINEAVALAKKFGDEESGKFVNGILGRLAREIAADPDDAPE